jgi:hypothetical protein
VRDGDKRSELRKKGHQIRGNKVERSFLSFSGILFRHPFPASFSTNDKNFDKHKKLRPIQETSTTLDIFANRRKLEYQSKRVTQSTKCGTEDRKDRNANDKLAKLGREDELGKLRKGRKADDGIAKLRKGRNPEDTMDRKADDELAKLEPGDSEPAPSVTSTKFKRLTRCHRLQMTRESEIVADLLWFKRKIRYRDARLGNYVSQSYVEDLQN